MTRNKRFNIRMKKMFILDTIFSVASSQKWVHILQKFLYYDNGFYGIPVGVQRQWDKYYISNLYVTE